LYHNVLCWNLRYSIFLSNWNWIFNQYKNCRRKAVKPVVHKCIIQICKIYVLFIQTAKHLQVASSHINSPFPTLILKFMYSRNSLRIALSLIFLVFVELWKLTLIKQGLSPSLEEIFSWCFIHIFANFEILLFLIFMHCSKLS
jgi:hypothetical protein